MLLLALLESGASALEVAAPVGPASVFTALVAIAGAVGTLALAIGPSLKVHVEARAEERKAEAAERKAAAEDRKVVAVDEKKLAEHVLGAFRAHYGDRVGQLLKHHLEIHDATFGNKVTGTDGMKQRVERLEELSAAVAAQVGELHRAHVEERHQQELLAAAEKALTAGGTNPGTGRR